MKKLVVFLLLTSFFGCKSDKKNEQTTDVSEDKKEVVKHSDPFESRLLDYIDVNADLAPGLKIEGFGIQKKNDNTHAFVFKLSEETLDETVTQFSCGIKAYYEEAEKPFKFSCSPKMVIKNDKKYLIIRNEQQNIKYYDSLDVYIYKRKDWKGSGRIAGFKVRDILIDNE